MIELKNEKIERVYTARTDDERIAAYDDWAAQYEADLLAFGFRLPPICAAVTARFVEPGTGPILDAGCGTGLQAEPLHAAGYGPFVGIDLSDGMLAVDQRKGIYQALHKMKMGERLDFADGAFPVTITMGAITPGHAPAAAFDELIRVTAPGGLVIFSLRVDAGQEPDYDAAIAAHTAAGRWEMLFATPRFVTMPLGEPDVENKIFVYKILP